MWSRSNVGYHGTWLWTMDGSNDAASEAAEYLYYGMQDNGTMATSNAGATPPTWTNPRCCDTFDVLAGPTWSLATTCCFTAGRSNHLQLGGLGYAGEAQINTYPAGNIPGFTWGNRLAGFGGNNVALITSAGVFFTNDITANPIVWTAMPAMPGGNPGTPCSIRTSTEAGTTTFFVQTGQCTGRGPDRLYRMDGTGGTWIRIDDDAGLGGIGIFAADPTNPDRLYISQDPRGQDGTPSMQSSIDGGMTWDADPELDGLMTAGGVFKYLTTQGPSTNRGGAGAAFQGYAQPLLLAWSAEDPGVLVAGGVDSGVFLSLDAGANWSLVTDPLTPMASGVDHLPRPRYAYFDTEPANGFAVYVGTQGRGVWRLAFTPPSADTGGPYVTNEGQDIMLSAAGSSDDGTLTYAWDLDDDGQFDDATGITVPFTTVGHDGVFTVRVKATDPDGAYDVADTTVTVNNVAPAIDTLVNDGPVDENVVVTVSGTASDPGWLDVPSATVDWGDGTPIEPLTAIGEQAPPDATLAFSATHVYGDNGDATVEVCVADDDTQTCGTTEIVVDNVDPTVTIDETDTTLINAIPTLLSAVGEPLDVAARAVDPGSDDLTITWDWDDDQPDDVQVALVNPPNPDPFPSPSIQPRDVDLTAPHTYLDACLHELRVTVVDDDAGSAVRHRQPRHRRERRPDEIGQLLATPIPSRHPRVRHGDVAVLLGHRRLHELRVRRGHRRVHAHPRRSNPPPGRRRRACSRDIRPPTARRLAQLRQRRNRPRRARRHQPRPHHGHPLLGCRRHRRSSTPRPDSDQLRCPRPEGHPRDDQRAARALTKIRAPGSSSCRWPLPARPPATSPRPRSPPPTTEPPQLQPTAVVPRPRTPPAPPPVSPTQTPRATRRRSTPPSSPSNPTSQRRRHPPVQRHPL